MKMKMKLLPTLLLLSSLAVAALGGYIKYGVLEPLGIHRDESIVAMPFVLYSDKGLQFMIEINREMAQQPTETVDEMGDTTTIAAIPSTEASTEQPTQAPTEVPTEQTTEAPEEQPTQVPTEVPTGELAETTEASVEMTESPTEAPTDAPTEPSTEPPTEPPVVELDDSWFENMLIIGDSRIHGMRNYYRFGNAYYFTSIGMNIYNVHGVWTSDQGHYECSIYETLNTIPFDKVLVGIGLNECNYEHAYIEAGFEKLIDLIHGYQPDIKIILTSVMMVTEKRARSDESFSIENLSAINDIIASFADNEKIFYIDVNEWAVDETGYLPEEMSFDGIHFYGTGYEEWGKWLRQKMGTLGIP